MATLGDLERAIMDRLWDSPAPRPASEIQAEIALGIPGSTGKELAITTVLTVLTRLEAKGFVTRSRDIRPHLFRASMSRADHMAELMHDVLGTAPDREAVLARFVGQVSPADASALRRMLDGRQG